MQALAWRFFCARVLLLPCLLGSMILGVAAVGSVAAAPAQAPSAAPLAATLPASSCSLVGTTRTCDLYAKTGSVAMPDGVTIPIWGYASSATGSAHLPGPALIANQGEMLVVRLHNQLAENSSLDFAGQNLVPDRTGVGPGGTKSYVISGLQPGTTLYQAGLTPPGSASQLGGLRQTAMGLSGALVVRPSLGANFAYDASTQFNDEALVIVSDIDPAFNAAPATFVMKEYTPKYWLINGKAFPQTDPIPSTLGNKLLLRYVNAGLQDHSLGLLGMHQSVVAADGKKLPFSYQVVAETLPAGQTMDSIATLPLSAAAGSKFALLNAAQHVDNNGVTNTDGTITFGGMLTFITTSGSSSGGTPPVTSNVQVAPNPTTGTSGVTLTATITSTTAANVTAAEYFFDTPGANGSGTPITITPGTTVSLSASITAASLAPLSNGDHPIYVHGQNATGWGAASSTVLTLAKAGPTTSSLSLTPNPTNGSADVQLLGTVDDTAAGNANVDQAEYFISDTQPAAGSSGTGTALTLATPLAPINNFSDAIPAATVAALAEGNRSVWVHGHDTFGNWGALVSITLRLDKTGPTTTSVRAVVSPNNGTVNLPPNTLNGAPSGNVFAVWIIAHFNDAVSGGINNNIAKAEGFVDTTGANGSGAVFLPAAGTQFNTAATLDGYLQIDLYSVQAMSEGSHTFFVHAQDAAGNWGPFATGTLIVDKTGPNVTNVVASPNPTNGATSVSLTATTTDPALPGVAPAGPAPASNVTAAEWFDGADPGAGNGTAMTMSPTAPSTTKSLSATLNVSTWALGPHTVSVRALDAAANWGPTGKVTLNVTSATPTLSITSGPTSSGVTSTAATIAWTTNTASSSLVNYGTTTAYGSNVSSATLVTSHSLNLTGLVANTMYHYQVSSTANSTTVTSADFTFTTSAAGPVVLVGSNAVQTNPDNNPPGTAEAFRYTAAASGTATRLWVYLTAPSNTATSVVVGLYTNTAQNNPGSLLTSGTIARPTGGWTTGWYSVQVTATSLSSGQLYWIAILGRGGVVQFVDTGTGGPTQTSAQTNLTALPATWTKGGTYNNAPASTYATTQ